MRSISLSTAISTSCRTPDFTSPATAAQFYGVGRGLAKRPPVSLFTCLALITMFYQCCCPCFYPCTLPPFPPSTDVEFIRRPVQHYLLILSPALYPLDKPTVCLHLHGHLLLFPAFTALPITAGDVWATVGWSHDLIPQAERSSNIVLVAPTSGTPLWADVWVVPSHAKGGSNMEGPSPLLSSWLEFSVMPGRIVTLSGLKTGASPLLLGDAEEQQGDDGGGDEWEGRDAMLKLCSLSGTQPYRRPRGIGVTCQHQQRLALPHPLCRHQPYAPYFPPLLQQAAPRTSHKEGSSWQQPAAPVQYLPGPSQPLHAVGYPSACSQPLDQHPRPAALSPRCSTRLQPQGEALLSHPMSLLSHHSRHPSEHSLSHQRSLGPFPSSSLLPIPL